MGFDFIVEPPYGTEIVRAIVSKEPLHTLRDVMKTLGEDTPFVQPANLARLTRGIRVEGRKAAKGTWAETAVRFTIEP